MTYRFVVDDGSRRLAVRVQAGTGQHSRYVGQHCGNVFYGLLDLDKMTIFKFSRWDQFPRRN